MTEEVSTDVRGTVVADKHYLRVSIASVGGIVLLVAGFIWQDIEGLRDEHDAHVIASEKRLDECRTSRTTELNALRKEFSVALERKADAVQASDRYTGSIAKEVNARIDQRLDSLEVWFQRQIDHIHNMMEQKQ